jgi:hypothetical protein
LVEGEDGDGAAWGGWGKGGDLGVGEEWVSSLSVCSTNTSD